MAETKEKKDARLEGYVPFLAKHYREKVVPALREQFKFKNDMQIPRIEKVVLNIGEGDGARDEKLITQAQEELTAIAGQRARVTRSRKSIAAFKVREGMPVGCSVTLRRARMWEFLHRLIYVALPRVRDFRGLPPKSFDGRGNFSLGVREHIIFTEIDIAKAATTRGLNITICTTAPNDEQALALLTELGMPFRK